MRNNRTAIDLTREEIRRLMVEFAVARDANDEAGMARIDQRLEHHRQTIRELGEDP